MTRTHKKNKQKAGIPNLLVIGGIILIATLLLTLKKSADFPIEKTVEPVAEELPEARFDRLLQEKELVFAFFHSNNCHLCLEMIEIVNEVYPEYKDKVSLVDINVYDELNKNLLIRADIHSIPTQVFINESGEVIQSIGLMSAAQLHDALDKLAGKQ